MPELEDLAIAELEPYGLSVRMIDALEKAEYVFVRDIASKTADQLRAVPQIGVYGIVQIRTALNNWLHGRVTRTAADMMGSNPGFKPDGPGLLIHQRIRCDRKRIELLSQTVACHVGYSQERESTARKRTGAVGRLAATG